MPEFFLVRINRNRRLKLTGVREGIDEKHGLFHG